MWYTMQVGRNAGIAQLVEHVIGNDEVMGPNPISSSKKGGMPLVGMPPFLLMGFGAPRTSRFVRGCRLFVVAFPGETRLRWRRGGRRGGSE